MKKQHKVLLAFITIVQIAILDCCKVAVADGIQTAGDVLQIALPATAAGLSLSHRDSQGTLQLGESLAVTLGLTFGLKYSVDDERPNGGRHSFPSGHTSVSFSAAEFMRKRYGWEYGVPAYVVASFVAYSRVESGEHFAHDVVAGAAIGILSSYIFSKPYKGWQVVSVEGDTQRVVMELDRRF
jgi:membrane-associated phospholipid phosphatase